MANKDEHVIAIGKSQYEMLKHPVVERLNSMLYNALWELPFLDSIKSTF